MYHMKYFFSSSKDDSGYRNGKQVDTPAEEDTVIQDGTKNSNVGYCTCPEKRSG